MSTARITTEEESVADSNTKKRPEIDIAECTDCESCLEICPEVFKRNEETGIIEVADLPEYPEDAVQEAIALCPADCIMWEEE